MKININHKQATKRIYGLDIIRAIAIVLVFIGHTSQHSIPPEWLKNIGRFGSLGVELFFVLSGFLIGGILLKLVEKGQFQNFPNLVLFWKRRWMRTIPLYIVALLAFLRFDYHGWHSITFHPEYWLFLQNLAWPIPDDFFTLSWSLAVEEHFYLWFPSIFLILYIFISKKSAFYTTTFIFLGIAISYRLSLPWNMEWNTFNFLSRMVVLSKLDSIMFGVLMAYIYQYHKYVWTTLSRLFPLWLILVLSLFYWYYIGAPRSTTPLFQLLGMTIQSLLLSLLLPWFFHIKYQPKGLFSKTIVWTSKISYSLYLGHILVIIFINHILINTGIYHTIYPIFYYLYPIYFICFYLLASFTYYTIERPFLKLRDEGISKKNIPSFIPFILMITYLIFIA